MNLSPTSFDIVTWNLHRFPAKSDTTLTNLSRMILNLDADLIAIQEIANDQAIKRLADSCPGWEYQYIKESDLNLGFFYKQSEIEVISPVRAILTDDRYAFPRSPVLIRVRHKEGLDVRIINIHLKCCGSIEDENRRRSAAEKLKAYMDANLPDVPLILAGDFNDGISGISDDENVFLNIMNDAQNYSFADLSLADSGQKNWSYPSWPSHLDHFLLSDELFDDFFSVETMVYDQCDYRYLDYVSDHRPVLLRLGTP